MILMIMNTNDKSRVDFKLKKHNLTLLTQSLALTDSHVLRPAPPLWLNVIFSVIYLRWHNLWEAFLIISNLIQHSKPRINITSSNLTCLTNHKEMPLVYPNHILLATRSHPEEIFCSQTSRAPKKSRFLVLSVHRNHGISTEVNFDIPGLG